MVDQAPAGITLRNEHGLDCVLVAMHIEDAHEFEAHIADESDLRAAGFVRLATGSDGPTDEELLRIEHEAEREECGYEELGRITRRAIANVCLALGEQKQAARVAELEAELAEYREQVHQESLLKADLEAAESELAATKAKLAEVERELASALRVSEGRARQRDELSIAYHRNQTVVEAAKRHDGARRDWLAVERYDAVLAAWGRGIEQALASAGTDADRTEPPRPEAGESGPVCTWPDDPWGRGEAWCDEWPGSASVARSEVSLLEAMTQLRDRLRAQASNAFLDDWRDLWTDVANELDRLANCGGGA